jgi:hypothetical protein
VKQLTPIRVLLGVIGIAIGIVGIFALREATLSTHEAVAAAATELVVSADTKGGEQHQTLPEMLEAQLLACRLEVTADVEGSIESLGNGRFRAVLTPALDETNRRQFRGCMEDWLIDHVRVNVIELSNTT